MINLARRHALKTIATAFPILGGCEFLQRRNAGLTRMNFMNNSTQDHANSGVHDFDFLVGNWRIENHRLIKRLQNCHDWETFNAYQHNRALPGGIGNFDDFVADNWRPGFIGMSLRLFNPQTKLWSIYWLDNQSGGLNESGVLLPPVVGRFENRVGVFECDDELDGKKIKVRYTWSNIEADSATWEQAMSADRGKTWEMNWRMKMVRISQAPTA